MSEDCMISNSKAFTNGIAVEYGTLPAWEIDEECIIIHQVVEYDRLDPRKHHYYRKRIKIPISLAKQWARSNMQNPKHITDKFDKEWVKTHMSGAEYRFLGNEESLYLLGYQTAEAFMYFYRQGLVE